MFRHLISFFSDHKQNLVSIVITTHVICARVHSAPYNGSLRLSLLLGDRRSKQQNSKTAKQVLLPIPFRIFLPFISLECSLAFATKKRKTLFSSHEKAKIGETKRNLNEWMEEMDIQTHTKAVFEPTKKHHSPCRFAMRFSLRMYTKNNKKQLN